MRLLSEDCVQGEGEDYNWDSPNIPAAIGVSIGAGLATCFGGALVFFPQMMKKVQPNVILGVSLALSAGVMLYVSFIEIFAKSLAEIQKACWDDGPAVALCTGMFFLGMLICVGLEYIVYKLTADGHSHDGCPAHTTEAELQAWTSGTAGTPPSGDASVRTAEVAVTVEDGEFDATEKKRLGNMGLMTALAIAVHNFPEGLATFLLTVENISSGASLGVAIAIHNVPEGLCVAMPIYYATGNKWKAFMWAFLSGLTEPIGGIVGFAALQPVFTPLVYGCVFSSVGGMMIFIAIHELLPAAHRYLNNGNRTTAWLIAGMMVMALSLVLFVQ
jgi:ZIP family zinc transporter